MVNAVAEQPHDLDGRPLPERLSFKDWLTYLGYLRGSDYWHNHRPNPELRGSSAVDCAIQVGSGAVGRGNDQCLPLTSSPVTRRRAENISRASGNLEEPQRFNIYNYEAHSFDDRKPNLLGNEDLRSKRARKRKTRIFRRSSSDSQESYNARRATRRPGKNRVRGRVITTSDSESSESIGESYIQTRAARSADRREESKEEWLCRLLGDLKGPRDVVEPEVFKGTDGGSLSKFLTEFETFFSQKYRGSDRQCAQVLGRYLGGSVKKAFEALDGATQRYSKLKPQLLTWYKTEKASQRHIKETQFEDTKMLPGESLTIYALRLERLVTKAYPGTVKEQERQLCKKFWATVPRRLVRVMADSERNLSFLDAGRKLTWTMIKKVAEAEDRHSKRVGDPLPVPENELWHGSISELSKAKQWQTGDSNNTFRRKEVTFDTAGSSSSSQAPNARFGRAAREAQPPGCHWCGKIGHLEAKCWQKLGACLVCGNMEHAKEECPKLKKSYSSFRPRCSICAGEHLGQECSVKFPLN